MLDSLRLTPNCNVSSVALRPNNVRRATFSIPHRAEALPRGYSICELEHMYIYIYISLKNIVKAAAAAVPVLFCSILNGSCPARTPWETPFANKYFRMIRYYCSKLSKITYTVTKLNTDYVEHMSEFTIPTISNDPSVGKYLCRLII